MNVFQEEKNAIWCEMDVENKSSHRWSTRAISPLTSIVIAEETDVDAQKMEKGRQFEIQTLKENPKTALAWLSHKLLGNFSATFEIFITFLEFSATLGFLRFFEATFFTF